MTAEVSPPAHSLVLRTVLQRLAGIAAIFPRVYYMEQGCDACFCRFVTKATVQHRGASQGHWLIFLSDIVRTIPTLGILGSVPLYIIINTLLVKTIGVSPLKTSKVTLAVNCSA